MPLALALVAAGGCGRGRSTPGRAGVGKNRLVERGELARRIYEAAHLTGTFTLRSGQPAPEYFDKFQFTSRPELSY
jgi:hypothetical protein